MEKSKIKLFLLLSSSNNLSFLCALSLSLSPSLCLKHTQTYIHTHTHTHSLKCYVSSTITASSLTAALQGFLICVFVGTYMQAFPPSPLKLPHLRRFLYTFRRSLVTRPEYVTVLSFKVRQLPVSSLALKICAVSSKGNDKTMSIIFVEITRSTGCFLSNVT